MSTKKPSPETHQPQKKPKAPSKKTAKDMPKEKGGYADNGLPEPTRYGDWEVGGRCTDF